jgi:hypothetical protein
MTALALGKDWRKATPQQQQQLTAEFKTLLVRTYSNALTGYKNQKVVYKPFKMAPTIPMCWFAPRSISRAASRFSSITAWKRSRAAGRFMT